MKFTDVERPAGVNRRRSAEGPLSIALRETLVSGRAVAIEANGRSVFVTQNSLSPYRKRFKEEGLQLRSRTVAGVVHVWLEHKSQN